MAKVMSDPDIMTAFQNPKVQKAIMDVSGVKEGEVATRNILVLGSRFEVLGFGLWVLGFRVKGLKV